MLGISYGELFLIVGATAALIGNLFLELTLFGGFEREGGYFVYYSYLFANSHHSEFWTLLILFGTMLEGPKDLPVIARAAGRLAGRAIGYVQVARGQFESIMQKSQVSQVHKELQDTMAQLEAIRYEIRSISIMNPVPFIRTLEGMHPPASNRASLAEKSGQDCNPVLNAALDLNSADAVPSSVHSQAMTYSRLAETPVIKSSSLCTVASLEESSVGHGLASVLPISAESAGLLPKVSDVMLDNAKGSDIVLEAIIEAEVAHNAKIFLSQPGNQMCNQ